MALLRHREPDVTDGTAVRRGADEEVVERTGPSPGLVRALCTLAGVAAAGFLLWLGSQFDHTTSGEFWPAVGLIAAAGLVLGLSQIVGGWTKWGLPTLSPTVFLLGFLPTAIVGTWILLTVQPEGGWQHSRFVNWTDDLGLTGFVSSLGEFWPAIPLVVGTVLAFSFDTTGPRTRVARRTETYERTDEPVVATDTRTDDRIDDDTSVAEDLRTRDETREPVAANTRTDYDGDDVEDDTSVAEDLRTRDEAREPVASDTRTTNDRRDNL